MAETHRLSGSANALTGPIFVGICAICMKLTGRASSRAFSVLEVETSIQPTAAGHLLLAVKLVFLNYKTVKAVSSGMLKFPPN